MAKESEEVEDIIGMVREVQTQIERTGAAEWAITEEERKALADAKGKKLSEHMLDRREDDPALWPTEAEAKAFADAERRTMFDEVTDWMMWLLVVATLAACGTVPGVDVDEEPDVEPAPAPAPVVVWLPDAPAPMPIARVPWVEVYGHVGLGQCGPCVTESGHGCCGTDGWTAALACGDVREYLVDCRQLADAPRGCGQDVVMGRRMCEDAP